MKVIRAYLAKHLSSAFTKKVSQDDSCSSFLSIDEQRIILSIGLLLQLLKVIAFVVSYLHILHLGMRILSETLGRKFNDTILQKQGMKISYSLWNKLPWINSFSQSEPNLSNQQANQSTRNNSERFPTLHDAGDYFRCLQERNRNT